PVIGSTCGEIPNVIADAGLIFPEEDVQALRDALQSIRDDSQLRRRLVEAGNARVFAHYTQAHIAAETYRIYRELL
ncbi:MAG: glycosyl transferase family 1, partial [Chloroflexi bacterium]|nr:glycosyl transferase family 1 [Chloroflexota bacterium]